MTLPAPPVTLRADAAARTLTVSFPTGAPRRAVWAALTDLGSVGAWLTPAAAAGGGRYVLTFDHEGHRHNKVFEVVECVPGRSLSGVLHDPGFPDSRLSAEIGPRGLALVHSDVPAELDEGYRAGWPFYLGRLAAALEQDAPAPPGTPE
ncbi:SRPBCC domain-containing protein [Nocardiopsis flavescens]|uniref:SRPBCC domain-containing protein n=1 Tax=Nocardiopsis flavescens TaxID=758803 RepID=UPI0036535B39